MPRRRRHLLPALAVACVLGTALVPAVTLACSIPIRSIGPITGTRSDLVVPTMRTVERSAWQLDATWVSTRPRVSQFVVLRRVGRFHGVSFRKQRAISIDARGPFDNGWLFFDDDDPDTPPCALTGRIAWQPPRIRVVQGRREIRIAATTQRTAGDRTGCILGPDHGVAACPNLTRRVIRLARPVGTRRIVLEQFA